MIIPYLIGFMIGCMFTMLIGSYAIGIYCENDIKKDVLIQEILKENKQHKKHYEAVNDMNRDYWG